MSEGNDKEKVDEKTFREVQFIQFISSLANSAMQHLGKILNPVTGATERNLEAAGATINLIALLKEKTEGNLSEREKDVITNALANLQLNYVDEVKRDEKAGADKEEGNGEVK